MLRPLGLSLLTLVLALTGTPAAGVGAGTTDGAPRYDHGLSEPVEDSYYPAKGDPTLDTLHYALDLTWLRGARVLRGTTTIRLRTTRPDRALRLDLSGRLTVRSVRLDGVPAGYRHIGNHLAVEADVRADERHVLRVTYDGTPGTARGPASRPDIARLGMRVTRDGQLWTMQEPFGAFTWYPVNDHPSDKALYDVRVSAPGRWVGVSNGELTHRRTTGRRTVTRWTGRDPVASYLVTLAVGPYRAHHQTGPRGLRFTYWVPRARPRLVRPLRRTPDALRWLERRLGRYPFDRVGIVVTPGGSAMETQTMVTLGAHNYGLGRFHVRSTIVHELAHHWYGDAVTPSDWSDLWMNEGMATYLHARWEDAHSDRPDLSWRWVTRDWAGTDAWYRTLYGPPGAYHREEFASANVYTSVALMWSRLRRRLGPATFDRLVRAWPRTHLHRNADRAELVGWWEARSGVELDAFFRRWLVSPDSPA